jgi:hypothetical protein
VRPGRAFRCFDEIEEIKKVWLSGEKFNSEIAEQFGISRTKLWKIAAEWTRPRAAELRLAERLSSSRAKNARNRNVKHGNPSPFKKGMAKPVNAGVDAAWDDI